MRFAYASDLHLEFEDVTLKNTMNADVLLLAGDICVAEDLKRHKVDPVNIDKRTSHRQIAAARYREFFKRVSDEFPHVLMVMGNHEHYFGDIDRSAGVLRDALIGFCNIELLDNSTRQFGDITVIGTSLWTDVNKGDPLTELTLRDRMSDYRYIRVAGKGYRKLRPADTAQLHHLSKQYIEIVLRGVREQGGKAVVMSHHAPSWLSVADRYKHDDLSGGYASDLSNLILYNEEIKVWLHGHTHDQFDYELGQCRVVCGPKGYPGQNVFTLKFFDL
jgi:Icc-related predicted phosphoesterase